MSYQKFSILSGTFLTAMACLAVVPSARAEDCTGVLPGANCTLDENTTAVLTINNGFTLFTSGSINLDHEIDGGAVLGDGSIATSGGGDTIIQNADIGSTLGIEQLSITDDDVWTTSAAINTDNDGSDIDLGAGDGGEVLNFLSGSSFLGEIDGHNGDIVNFGADGAGGNFSTVTQIEGVSVVLTSGSLTIGSSAGSGVPLGALSVNAGADLTINSNVTTSGALDIDGDVYIRAGRVLSADTYVADADSAAYTLGVKRTAGSTSSAQITISSGGPVDFSNDSLTIDIGSLSQALVNETISSVIIGNGGATVIPNFSDNSYMYDFVLQQNGDNVDLIVTVNTIDELASSSSNRAVVRFLFDDLAGSEVAAINQIQSILGNISTREAFNEALESVLPDLDGGFSAASHTMMDQIQGAIYDRTVSSRYFDANRAAVMNNNQLVFVSGKKDMMTGEVHKANYNEIGSLKGALWAKALIQTGAQSADNVDGFDLNAEGLIVGLDIPDIDGDFMFGGALLMARSQVSSDNATASKNDIDSIGASLYGSAELPNRMIFNGALSYIRNDNNVTRFNVGTVNGSNATGDFKSEHLAMNAGLSQYRQLDNNVYFQPHAFISYDYISADEYTEKGSSDLALRVRYGSLNTLTSGVGAILGNIIRYDDVVINPSAHLSYEYSLLKDGIHTNVGLADKEFDVDGHDPSKHMVNAGVNVKVQELAALRLDAGYNVGYDGDQNSHSFSMNVLYDF
ncbi:MAG: hypothetical protein COB14_03840 [Alphaproteobacteria bacterium]|nr:MAG: hypothetical protein COB14_03840 [Alphaproteobacteria bacterium]